MIAEGDHKPDVPGQKADEARDVDSREKIGGRDADPRGGGGELSLCGPHIRTATQKLAGIADRQRFCIARGGLRLKLLIKHSGTLAQKHGEAIGTLAFARLEERNSGLGRLKARATPLHVEL